MAEKKEETPNIDILNLEADKNEEEIADDWTQDEVFVNEPELTESQIIDIRYRAPHYRDKYNNVNGEELKRSYPNLTKAMGAYIDELAKNEFADAPDANVNDF